MRLVWLAGFFGSPLLLHAAVVRQHSGLMVAFALLVSALLMTRGRVPALMVWLMAAGAAVFAAVSWTNVGVSANLALFTQSASYLLVAWIFGASLRAKRTPLIEAMAAVEHGGALPAELKPYTRRVTIFWTVLMGGMSVVAVFLGAFASQAAWSWFTNMISWLLIAAGYFGEYYYRLRRWPSYRHSGPIQTLFNIIARAPEYFTPASHRASSRRTHGQ